ncbi:MAG: dephospho-CoA kinase [Clostridia bacterium]|jgi:dephospho-CoA kinase|nr:dephospho-CoA kinase [Clostridia bacterium]
MICYGLTGKTGAGKSTVAAWLRDRGWYVIDGDVLAREIVAPGSPVLERLTAVFGADILQPDGALDRKALVDRLHDLPCGVETLNAITHPAIDALVEAELEAAEQAGYTHCVFDAAALLESPSKARCDKIIVVTAPEDVRLQRILARDGLTIGQAFSRMAMQKDDDWYLSQADIVIRNYPPYTLEEELSNQVIPWQTETPDENED